MSVPSSRQAALDSTIQTLKATAPPATFASAASMFSDRTLPPGQPLSLRLAAGVEVMCTSGALRLTTTGPWLGEAWAPPAQQLPAGRSWRASEDLWVKLEGIRQPSRFRLMPMHPS